MSKNKEYEIKNLTWSENLQLVRNFVVERSNATEHIDRIFAKYQEQITIPEVKNIFTEYYNKSENSFWKTSKVDTLSNTLLDLYKTQSNAITGDNQLGERFYQDPRFKEAIRNEAKNLHSGTTFFSMDLATKEIRTLRLENNKLQSINQSLNTALTNLVRNVKERFGLKEKDIDNMMNVPPVERSVEINTNKEVVKGNTSKGTSLEL